MRKLVIIGSIMSAIAVIIGAFGAHALKPLLSITELQTYETGVKYHLIHSLAIILIALLSNFNKNQKVITSAYLLFIGIILFSFSLYLLSLKQVLGIENWSFLGPITPLGGLLFISGWLLLCWSFITQKND